MSAAGPLKRLRRTYRQFQKRAGRARRAFAGEVSFGVRIARCDGFDVAHRLGTADERVLEHSFANDIFFANVPEYRPAPDHIILDVGAHIGTFSLLAASKVPQGRVFAVEASAETFDLLRINVALNRLDNVEAVHVALSDRPGEARLYHDPRGNWGHSLFAEGGGSSEVVPVTTLAVFMKERGIERIDFAKFNCEGAEYPILLTAPQDVLARIRMMVVLYHGDIAGRYQLPDLTAALERSGYTLSFRKQSDVRGWIVATRR